jgi:hypothetical protein
LPDLTLDTCGNYVIDEGEDCDLHSVAPYVCAGPGEEKACHFICSDSASVCPGGFGCGNDGLCRRASQTFVAASGSQGYVWPTALRSGDFDADGHGDLLLLGPIDSFGYRSARALFSQGFSLHSGLSTLPTELANPAIGSGATNGLSQDIAFGDFDGVALLRGYPDRSADYTVFPTISLPPGAHARTLMTDVLPAQIGDELIALITTNGVNELRGGPFGVPPVKLVQVVGGEKELEGTRGLSSARFDETLPCEQIILGYHEANRVDLFSTCRNIGGNVDWNVGGAVVSITLPPATAIDQGAVARDIDLDGHLDLVIGANGRTYVAFGLGDGQFISQKVNGTANEAAPYDLPPAAGGAQGFPLEIADLNGDGQQDFVVDSGIVLSQNADYVFGYINFGAPWSEAVVANLNANDLPDVVAIVDGALDIHFFNNAGGGILGPATLPTEGVPSHLSVGDFDGDLLNDLVFSESIAEHGELSDHLSFAFGSAFGTPQSPVATGEVGKLGQIVIGHIDESAGADPMAEVGVVAESKGEGPDSIALLPGRASRAIFSTLPLRTGPIVHLPVSLAFGRFGDQTPDIAALATSTADGRLSLFRIEAFDEEGLVVPNSSDPLPSNFIPGDVGKSINLRYGATVIAIDLSNDGLDEALVVGAYANTQQGAFAVANYDIGQQKFDIVAAQAFDGQVTTESILFADDIDGDGNQDVVLTTGTFENPGELIVIWGNGSGVLADLKQNVERIRFNGLGVTAVAALRSPQGKGKMLIASTKDKSYLLEMTEGRQWAQVEMPDVPVARAFAVIDFDHDGVEDLAVQSESGLELIRSVPK